MCVLALRRPTLCRAEPSHKLLDISSSEGPELVDCLCDRLSSSRAPLPLGEDEPEDRVIPGATDAEVFRFGSDEPPDVSDRRPLDVRMLNGLDEPMVHPWRELHSQSVTCNR
jgi:hypothetical protein